VYILLLAIKGEIEEASLLLFYILENHCNIPKLFFTLDKYSLNDYKNTLENDIFSEERSTFERLNMILFLSH
jgi:hypothetical protein